MIVRLLLALTFVTAIAPQIQAAILAKNQLLTPLAPSAESNGFSTAVTGIDPQKTIWVAYQILAISESDDPSGEIVLDAAFEGVPIPLSDEIVIVRANELKKSESAGTIAQQLELQFGKRSPEELKEIFGDDLYKAYVALNEKRGSILQGTIIKQYSAIAKSDTVLLASVERATGLQPMTVSVVIGQGDIPPEYLNAGQSSSEYRLGKWAGSIFAVLLIVYFLRRKRQ